MSRNEAQHRIDCQKADRTDLVVMSQLNQRSKRGTCLHLIFSRDSQTFPLPDHFQLIWGHTKAFPSQLRDMYPILDLSWCHLPVGQSQNTSPW